MFDFFERLFASDGFMPHGHCYLWTPGLVWLHVVSDAMTGLAYTTIPFTLLYIARRRRDLPFNGMFFCFGTFIIACGSTHFMEIWNVWTPMYWLAGWIKAITAGASVSTAFLLVRLAPQALAIPTKDDLRQAHDELKRAHAALEDRVAERTAELLRKNEELASEIVERKRAEDLVELLSSAGIVGIVRADTAGRLLEANSTFLDLVGYSREEFARGDVLLAKITPPEYAASDLEAWRDLREKGRAPLREKEYFRRDGSRVPVLAGGMMIDASTNDELVGFVLDLSERRRAEAALQESEARKTAVMDAALDAILLVDQKEKIVDVNRAAEELFGHPRSAMLGERLSDLLVPARLRDTFRNAVREHVAGTDSSRLGRRFEIPALREDGSEFPAEVALVRIATREGVVFTGYVRDITERKQAAEAVALRAANSAAEEAHAELEAFSYTIAHDLRAPLRAINGFGAAVLEDWGPSLNDEGRDHLRRIMNAAERMSDLIDALLGLARLTRTEPRREPVDLSATASNVVAQLQTSDPRRRVDVRIAPDLVVDGDPRLVRALLDNLIGNAWKFTGKVEAAIIEIGREIGDGPPTYFVRDNGAGFDMSLVGKLFAPFRRLHDETEFEGTGIGLATVQRIAKRHGGRVWAESKKDEGAIFRFTLEANRQLEGDARWIGGT